MSKAGTLRELAAAAESVTALVAELAGEISKPEQGLGIHMCGNDDNHFRLLVTLEGRYYAFDREGNCTLDKSSLSELHAGNYVPATLEDFS